MRQIFALLAALWLTPLAASAANVLVTDVSKDQISIRANFTGESLLLFGAIDTSLYGPVDGVVVTLRGPGENVVLRKKQKQLGIWANGLAYEMGPLPGFYAVVSSADLDALIPLHEQAKHGIGTATLSANLLRGTSSEAEKREALAAFIRLKEKDALFETRADRVQIINDKLFRAEITLPAGMPVGRYVSEFFAFKNGRLVGYQTGELPVDIVGAGHILHKAAYEMSFIYGLGGVIMALFMGWAVAVIFRRR
jgi:uncharacterized protein (TIGR02186 family)